MLDKYHPKKLIIFSRDELKQFEMAQDFPVEKYPFIRVIYNNYGACPSC